MTFVSAVENERPGFGDRGLGGGDADVELENVVCIGGIVGCRDTFSLQIRDDLS